MITEPLSGYVELIVALAKARESRGMSQAQLAERVGVTEGAVAHWERGRRVVHGRALFALADALGYDLVLIPREDA